MVNLVGTLHRRGFVLIESRYRLWRSRRYLNSVSQLSVLEVEYIHGQRLRWIGANR